MEIESASLVHLPLQESYRWSLDDMFERVRYVSDVQVVDDGSGPGTVGMIEKQLSAAGIPTWTDLKHRFAVCATCRHQLCFKGQPSAYW